MDFFQAAAKALALAARYYDEIGTRPIAPRTSSADLLRLLDEPLPQHGRAAADLVDIFERDILPNTRHNGHPRFFGYISSPGSPPCTVAATLTAFLNSNVTSWRSGPAAAELEHIVIRWIREFIGVPPGGAGVLVSGGSMANFAGLAAARERLCPGSRRSGVNPGALRIYASRQAHLSIAKSAALLGVGSDFVISIGVDAALRMDMAELERRVAQDAATGARACIVASAGTAATGAVDPLKDIADIAGRYGAWLHVDGAYGGFAAATSAADLFRGIDRADSIALDPHKWLYVPVGCGCILYRDPAAAKAAFSEDAEYTRVVGLENEEAFAFWGYGPELSRPFRALSVWMQLKAYGAEWLRKSIEANIDCARYFAELIQSSDEWEMLAPVALSIFCFRRRRADNAGNERIMLELQRGGSSYLSNAMIGADFALRGCVLNPRTTRSDMDRLYEDCCETAKRAGL